MEIGIVAGSVWATKKDEKLNGQKLLVINLMKNGKATKEQIVASDIVGAGVEDVVLITTGASARFSVNDHNTPIDAAVVGIIDKVEVDLNEY